MAAGSSVGHFEAGPSDASSAWPASPGLQPSAGAPIALFGLILALSLAIGWLTPGFQGDVDEHKEWARWLVRNGLHEAYRANIDYPPVPLILYKRAGEIYQAWIDPSFNERAALASHAFTFLIKLPAIAFHLVLAFLVYALARPHGSRPALLAAAAYGLNPTALYDAAHLGHTDAVHGAFLVSGLGALTFGWPGLAGGALALAALSKPQAWPLLPLAGWLLLRWHGLGGGLRALAVGGGLTVMVLLPWILGNRLHHALRFFENLSTHSVANHVIAADAHNLWWLPTLIRWDWIDDAEPLLGPVSYRAVGILLTLAWLGLCLLAATRLRRRSDLYLVAAALTFGFFMLMVRAHENHGYLALPLLALAAALAPRWWPLCGLVSLSVLANLALRDPLLLGPYVSVPDPGQPAPPLLVAAQLGNVALNFVILGLFAWALLRIETRGPVASTAEVRP